MEAGADPPRAGLLGHRCLATTALYTSVAIKDLREVLARAHPRR
jgi:site-specific recombinase XerD